MLTYEINMHYKYLLHDGIGYKIRNMFSLIHFSIFVWFLIGILLFFYSENTTTGLSFIVSTFVFILMLLIPSKTKILPHEKIFKISAGAWRKEPHQYRFSDFEGFDVETMCYIGIPVNTVLFGRFIFNGKRKRYFLAQSFKKAKMQGLAQELDELINT